MATLTGLQSGEFTDIDVVYSISIDGDAGQTGQVLSSDGQNTLWIDGGAIDREDLTAADTTITISGTGSYDGQVARTIQTNKVPNTLTFTGYDTGTFDGSSALSINLVDTDNQLVLSEGSGITITNLGGLNRRIAANIDADTINFDGAELTVSKVPNTLTFTGYDTGTFDGSAALSINLVDTNTEYTGTAPIDISAGNAISVAYDDDTIFLDGGELAVHHLPNTLTFTGYDTGTFDGSAGLSINLVDTNTTYTAGSNISIDGSNKISLKSAITAMTGITYLDDGSATTLTGSTYPQKETVGTYLNLNSNTNIISPYFLHDVYDPSSTAFVSLTTSFVAIFSGNLKNSFVAKATSCVIELAIYNYAINGNRFLYLQLGDNAGDEWSVGTDGGGSGTGTRTTARLTHYPDETDRQTVRVSYLLTGLTIGNTYVINPMAKTQSVTNYVAAGGGYPNCILRGYYLP
tara:strand:+ start:72 stop:1457 length:1386 start_codon:yes stop_codon:yes gene_type:complete